MTAKKALILNGSPRKKGNTAWLCSGVAEQLEKKGVETTFIHTAMLKSSNNGCIGCKGCQNSRDYLCVFKDDVQPIVASMPTYDYLVLGTSIYFYGPSAQLKLVLDRMFSLLKAHDDGSFIHPFKDTKFGLLIASGGPFDHGCDLTVETFRRIAENFNRKQEVLTMSECPLSPELREDAADWEEKIKEFVEKLIA